MEVTKQQQARSSGSCATSMASLSSEGSNESPLVEQEDIAVLTHDVRNFKEALGKLRHTIKSDRDTKQETLRVVAHERLGEVLRILRTVLEKYPALQSSELLVTAGTLIQNVKGFCFEDDKADPKEFVESIDQLALAFSSRVSEYLMGDLDTNLSLSSSVSSKTKSCENLAPDQEGPIESGEDNKSGALVSSTHHLQLDTILVNAEHGVEFALNRAKLWAKHAKDILMYVEKRAHLEMEYTRNLNKLALTVRPLINEESNLPFQSIYCTALDHDMDNSNSSQVTCSLLLGSKFLEPLGARRTEHEKIRRQLKEQWFRELSQMHDVVLRMRKARTLYVQRQREADRKPMEEDTLQKALEAEASYKASVAHANERHAHLYSVKLDILQRIHQMLWDSDAVLKTVTVAYFQLHLMLSSPLPVQFQTLCESSRLYEAGSQYTEAVKKLPHTEPDSEHMQLPFTFEQHHQPSGKPLEQQRKSTDSLEGEDLLFQDVGYISCSTQRHSMSKAAETHTFRKLKTPSRCRECDSYVYFMGADCTECGLACHRKCLETLAIQCGHKRLPRKMTTFGVDLTTHLMETHSLVPHIVVKCIDEIDRRGKGIVGIYRVSGVKSRVEKLCQAFENCADLVDLTDIHPNVIANVLKLYLRQLPEPLLTCSLYQDFIRIAKECPSSSQANVTAARNSLKELVRKLPNHHYLTLAMLMLHLKRVSNNANINNMPASNLGIVFGPTLLQTSDGSCSLTTLVDTVHQTRTLELMIANAEEIFSDQNVAVVREAVRKIASQARGSVASSSSGLGRSFSFLDRGKKIEREHRSENAACSLFGVEEGNLTGNASDDEISYFLLADGASRTKMSPQLTRAVTPKIFKGSLKDYQGLEGLSSLGARLSNENENSHQKLRKSVSDSTSATQERTASSETSESFTLNQCLVVNKKVSESMTATEGWNDSNPRKPSPKLCEMGKGKVSGQRTESSADSDYSFESHASSSVESRSPRELDEGSEVFVEQSGLWSKKSSIIGTNIEGRPKLASGDSPLSSLSHSLDESQGSDAAEELDVSVRRSMATVQSTHSQSHFISSSNADHGDNIYIPLFQKQTHNQEHSVCSSKMSSYHSKCTSSSSSSLEKQDITELKNQFLGFQEDTVNIKMQPKLLSSVASVKSIDSHQSGQCSTIDTIEGEVKEVFKQRIDVHKNEAHLQFDNISIGTSNETERNKYLVLPPLVDHSINVQELDNIKPKQGTSKEF